MHRSTPSLLARHDTFFGVCEALGQDLRINANWFRVVFAAALLLSPLWTLGAYVALGLAIAVSRWFFPVRSTGTLPAASDAPRGENDAEPVELAEAA
jgi:hypothetical protein